MTTLMDTVRTTTESRSLERSFEVESPGGYARTVVGRLAYFDDEAQTYMVLTRSGVLVRVPLRDITSSHGRSAEGSDRCRRPLKDVEASERDNRFARLGRWPAVRRGRDQLAR